jgi:hypothetical protein
VEGFFIEHDTGIGQMHLLADLQTWLLAKLLWEPDQDLQALIEDFTDHYYGPAAPQIREYITLLERETTAKQAGMRWNANIGQYRHLTPEFIARCQSIFDAAEGAVADDETLLQRVRIARMSVDRATLMAFAADPAELSAVPATVVTRYRNTWRRAIEERIAEKRRGAVRPFVDDLLAIVEAYRQPRPLPPELADADPEGIIQIGPMVVQRKRDADVLPDPDAAMGIAATHPITSDYPFTIGVYAWDDRKILTQLKLTPDDVPTPGYNLYRIGETSFTPASSMWITRSWRLRYPLETVFDPDNPDQEYEVYASLRFSGPSFDAPGDEDRVHVDRVILVPVE